MTEEVVKQGRESLRTGNLAPTIHPADYANVKSGAEAKAQLRFEQQLQNADIPENFGGHSPRSESEVRALQRMNEGTTTEEENKSRAVLNARARELGNQLADMSADEATQALTDPSVGKGKGIERGTGNMRDVPHEIARLENDLKAHNTERAELGLEPIKLDGLDNSNQKLQQLDDNIAKVGAQAHDSLGGLESGGLGLPPFNTSNMANERDKMRKAVSEGRVISLPKIDTNGKLAFDTPTAPGTGEVPESAIPQRARVELVRINDSRNLLRGNASGYSFKDIQMSPQMRQRLGMKTATTGDVNERINQRLGLSENVPPARDLQQEQMREMFGLNPTDDNDLTGLPTADKVDRAALMPAEKRASCARSRPRRHKRRR